MKAKAAVNIEAAEKAPLAVWGGERIEGGGGAAIVGTCPVAAKRFHSDPHPPHGKGSLPAFRRVDLMERRGEMAGEGFITRKHGIFEVMEQWALKPEDLSDRLSRRDDLSE